ncbi:SDR family oxidoreductase [Oceanihabitans sediminis]|uniref:SDR family NAD(P)-dependent oxidoreductase n=1 Tax=Oceanihabitans sediminis TaxID=1812012 RepID=A0A368P2L1_9FLAO|nr:SDR family oxidoreductase [Oceanihabitans sediminis]MDX1279083.1 SDR family oxidoreductase [Oceanihabitans sediminis]RBP28459.1 NAD(P)-dependent dehydrogenase (short-subunit alcohol dehydrogenase family) [Oceanihabitans sediminis]RCU56656.1 SDR family NAD(P)-dependent oxidoreductase [Oceanihabitans sediminis]
MNRGNKSIVITGGAGGIGTACAQAFKGEKLILTDYSQELVAAAVDKLLKEGYDVSGIACDITSKEDVNKLRQYVADKGGFKAFIHTAGVSGSMQNLRKIFDIDLVATDLLVDAFYEMADAHSVAILLSSMMAHTIPASEKYDAALMHPQKPDSFETVSQFVHNNSDRMYNFVKRGVILVSKKNLNKWGQKKARILTVSPGVIETDMALKAAEEHPEQMEMMKKATPMQRNGQPEDIANVVAFLASEKASFITGTDILVDGGVMENIKKM